MHMDWLVMEGCIVYLWIGKMLNDEITRAQFSQLFEIQKDYLHAYAEPLVLIHPYV